MDLKWLTPTEEIPYRQKSEWNVLMNTLRASQLWMISAVDVHLAEMNIVPCSWQDSIDPHGHLRWKYQTGGWFNKCPAIGSGGTIFVGTTDSNLYAIHPDGSLKWKYATGGQLLDTSLAVVASGTV